MTLGQDVRALALFLWFAGVASAVAVGIYSAALSIAEESRL